MSDLEREFAKLYVTHAEKVKSLVASAEELLTAAKNLADETGVPFKVCAEVYMPEKCKNEFSGIDYDFFETLTDLDYEEAFGWQKSYC